MLRRKTGSVVCPSCGSLVGVRDEKCYTCGRGNPGLWGFGPALRQLGTDLSFVPFVVGTSVVIYVGMLLLSGAGLGMAGMGFLSPSGRVLVLFGASGALPVFALDRWWSVLSAIWLHAGLLHILFNMMSLYNIGPSVVDLIGPARTAIVYIVGGACGFLLSSLAGRYMPALPILGGAGITVGASASIFALFGALVHYGRMSGSRLIYGQARQWALIMFVYGLLMPGIDNYAHAGGFVGGYAVSAVFNPLTRERGDHLIIALVCVVVSLLAVVVSFLQGVPY